MADDWAASAPKGNRPDPRENVRAAITGALYQRRNALANEKRQLQQAAERLVEIDAEIAHIDERLKAHGSEPPAA